ncbi:hypothetical protein [Streptomyces sp. 3211]|uniref:hypothetical protein n=1 Tax=Streptomyces sp. 3211 TaxID=1964449 RepID=UPI0009A5103F|nr:hypothetical protein [Streptomyces sp. 3211]
MTRSKMAARRRRTADRDARRASLDVLLDRAQRGTALTPDEAALLRAHVAAETTEADELRRTVGGQQTAMQRAYDRTRAAEAAIVEAEEDASRALAQATRDRQFAQDRAKTLHAERERARSAERTLARVRSADTLADALTAVAVHDGLSSAAISVHAAFTALADHPAVVRAEQDREHAIALATAERRAHDAERQAAQEEATALRFANYLAATQRAAGAPNWAALPDTVKALADRTRAAERNLDQALTAWRSARTRARRQAAGATP